MFNFFRFFYYNSYFILKHSSAFEKTDQIENVVKF